jgi:hypothetical protein
MHFTEILLVVAELLHPEAQIYRGKTKLITIFRKFCERAWNNIFYLSFASSRLKKGAHETSESFVFSKCTVFLLLPLSLVKFLSLFLRK